MESLENQMRQFEVEIAARMKPTAEEIARLRESIPADAPLPPSPREEAIRLLDGIARHWVDDRFQHLLKSPSS